VSYARIDGVGDITVGSVLGIGAIFSFLTSLLGQDREAFPIDSKRAVGGD